MDVLCSHEIVIAPELHGERADVALAKILPQYSRSQLSIWLKQGLITINGKNCKPKEKVMNGDLIQVRDYKIQLPVKTGELQPEAIPLEIIYEDEWLLIVNKPANLVVHPGAGNWQHTLVNGLLHYHPDLKALPRAGIIHRLDKDTTGLLVVGKTLESHTALSRQMQQREIHRSYLALVYGHIVAGGSIETHYGRHPVNRLKMAVCEEGREAITHYRIKKKYNNMTLLDVRLLTGRTHQIRVHMAHIKHPIVGDPLYGGRTKLPSSCTAKLRETIINFKRQALHAAHLEFIHPVREEVVDFSAPLPQDFKDLLQALESDGI